MSVVVVPRGRFGRPLPSRRFLLGGLAGVAAVALAIAAVQQLRSPSGAGADSRRVGVERRELARYTSAIDPLSRDGGRIVVEGLKAGVTDIGQSRFSDEVLVTMATGWVNELTGVHDSFVKVAAPAFLADAKWHYDHAVAGYISVAQELQAAANAHGDQRTSLVALAVRLGEESDAVWNRARDIVHRETLRLTPVKPRRGSSGG